MRVQLLLWTSVLPALAAPLAAQTGFDHDRAIAATVLPDGILTEGFPGAPVVAIPFAALGLVPGDDIDALSFGDDFAISVTHSLTFSVDGSTAGVLTSGTDFETTIDTFPGTPPAAAGDLFWQILGPTGNILAPPTYGYATGTMNGDEANATWASLCGAMCDDLDAFDYTAPAGVAGVYFSLTSGSVSLPGLGFTGGDILYSDLSGAPPVLAFLGGPLGVPATDVNLGIAGFELDALNLMGTLGPVGGGGGVIFPGVVGPSISAPAPPASTHLLQYSTALAGADADVLVRTGAALAGIHTTAAALGLLPFENLNALEATPRVFPCAVAADLNQCNGIGVNVPFLTASPVIAGSTWSATLYPFGHPAAGLGTLLMRPSVLCPGILTTFGELLISGPNYFSFTLAHVGDPGPPMIFSGPVPPDPTLCGLGWAAQGFVTGGGFSDLSSAVWGSIGY